MFKFDSTGIRQQISNALVANCVYGASKAEYMKHYIAIAAMFESRPDCLIYLNESMKN